MSIAIQEQSATFHRTETARRRSHEYVLIFSHARSYTTLLCHILGSHHEISGYYESLMWYATAGDLAQLNTRALQHGCYREGCRYFIDKILYNEIYVSDDVLGHPLVTPIFMVREAEPAIESLVRMRLREHELGIHLWQNGDRRAIAEAAAEYYTSRLGMLRMLCTRLEALGKRGLFLPGRCLLDNTASTFRFLERELGLSGPLREEYTVFKNTGRSGCGDTSETIRSGRIVRERSDQEVVSIPPAHLDEARQAYAECSEYLLASPALVRS